MSQTIQLRRGTAAQWTAVNPVLASGEVGVELVTGKFKIGDGTTTWNLLPYATDQDIIGNITGDVTGNVSGTAANVTGVVAVANGGTGSATGWTAAQDPGHKHSALWASDGSPQSVWSDTAGNVGVGIGTFGTNAVKVLGIASGTAPTTSPADMGQVYVADRNGVAGTASLHLRNEDDTAGISLNKCYGEMYHYQNTDLMLIGSTNVYHAIIIKTTGLVKGWTYKIGTTALIAEFAANVAGVSTKVRTAAGHNLVSGEIVSISGCAKAEYNTSHVITWIDANWFSIPVVYGAETIGGAEQWIRGSSLRANSGSAGVYRITWNCTLVPVGANNFFKVEAKQNNTDLDNMATSAKLASGAGYYPMSAGGLVTIADGDYIWLQMKNETDATDIRVRHINLNISKVG